MVDVLKSSHQPAGPTEGLSLTQSGTPVVFEQLFTLLGKLNYAFTNTESLIIHLIAGLARVDMETASIIFLTLNTTRARLTLVERLAKREGSDAALSREVLAITAKMVQALKVKNKYNHCIYSFDSEEQQASTIMMKVYDKKDAITFGKLDLVDDAEIEHICQVIADVENLNRSIWKFLFRNQFPV